jgi:phage shock protein PspC (stress-responsive transcriptional regulator)
MSIADEIGKLDELYRRGALSQVEFERAKARVLGEALPRHEARGGTGAAALNGWRRSRDDAWLGGVCGGLEPFTGVAAWVWRLIFVALVLCGGTGVVLYLLLWFFVPRADDHGGFGADPLRAG